MPRTIESYRKLTSSPAESDSPDSLPNLVPIAILTIIVIFCFNVGSDAHNQMETIESKMKEEAKLCVVEFGRKACDGLRPSMECQKLLDCVQLKQSDSRMSTFLRICSQQILEDFQFPTVVVGLLLLFHLGQSFKTNQKRDHPL